MDEDPLLLCPGPVPIAESTRAAMAEPMINHRGDAFEATYAACQDGMAELFGTDDAVVIANGSGSAAIEMAVSNLVGPDDNVAAATNGLFGERLSELSGRYAGHVETVAAEWGEPIDLEALADAAADADVITVVHVETSTGMVNSIEAVGDVAAAHGALVVVDGVASVGGEIVRADDWGLDVVATGSQKAIGAPPGLSMLSVSDRAADRADDAAAASYLSLPEYLEYAADHQTPSTSAVPLFCGLREALSLVEASGHLKRIERQATLARAFREAGRAMGLSLLSAPDAESTYANTVSVFDLPEGVAASAVVDGMLRRGVEIRAGLGKYQEDAVRLSSMGGTVDAATVRRGVDALQSTLSGLGADLAGDGLAAADAVLDALESPA